MKIKEGKSMVKGNDMPYRPTFPIFTDSSFIVEKNSLNNLDNSKFASFVQKVARRLKIIVFILNFIQKTQVGLP